MARGGSGGKEKTHRKHLMQIGSVTEQRSYSAAVCAYEQSPAPILLLDRQLSSGPGPSRIARDHPPFSSSSTSPP
ncbi:hypothetical protein EJB05_28046, partial [Eragrostis curvula]